MNCRFKCYKGSDSCFSFVCFVCVCLDGWLLVVFLFVVSFLFVCFFSCLFCDAYMGGDMARL